MLRYLNRYIDFVQGLKSYGNVYVEHRVGIDYTTGLVWGTADCIGVGKRLLTIADLKYGKGIHVDPNSAQLKIYAIAAIDTLKIDPEVIELIVFQPRLEPEPKAHVMSTRELRDWELDELLPAIQRITDNVQTEEVGPWCRWCVRRNECAAFASRKSGSASEIFDDGLDMITLQSLNHPAL